MEAAEVSILVCAQPAEGHVSPLSIIAKHLLDCGYQVSFLTGTSYRQKIEDSGLKFIPLTGKANYTLEEIFKSIISGFVTLKLPPGSAQTFYMLEHLFCDMIPAQHECIQEFLRGAKGPVVVVHDVAFGGTSPVLLGAEGLKPAATIGIGINPLCLSDENVPPFGSGLEYDDSYQGRERNKSMLMEMNAGLYSRLNRKYDEVLESLGASKSPWSFFDAMVLMPNVFLQMCIPGVEYPRSELPSSLCFAGNIPQGHREQMKESEFPKWWPRVTNPSTQVVFVCQGTASRIRFEDLVIPTLEGLADEDVLIVASLGKKGAVLSSEVQVPKNAYIMDYIPYDDIFPHADVFISNGGYGGFQHAINHGLPMVIAGINADKPEVAARAEWTGVAINLKTQTATKEAVRKSVLEVLSSPKYRARAQELQAEAKTFDALSIVAKTVEEVVTSNEGDGAGRT
jgi:Erythromycin biosynthesis protein CIII-like, C-terminal domain